MIAYTGKLRLKGGYLQSYEGVGISPFLKYTAISRIRSRERLMEKCARNIPER